MKLMRRPTHPGVVFKEDVLEPLGLSITQAAEQLHITRKALSEVVNGKTMLSPEMAVRWAKFTDTTPESWYQMQVNLNLWDADLSGFTDSIHPAYSVSM